MPDPLDAAIATALAPITGVRVAFFFGSRSRGTARQDSDLDLGVRYTDGQGAEGREATRREIIASLADALGAVGERADVVDLERTDPAVAFAAISATCVLARTREEKVRLVARVARMYDADAPRRALFVEAARRLGARSG